MKHNHKLFLDIAKRVAEESSALRLKVGAVIARDGSIVDFGYNGTPPGADNDCEVRIFPSLDSIGEQFPMYDSKTGMNYRLDTKPDVIHAEMNAILKCAKLGKSTKGATLYLTHNPCCECAKAIIASGIVEVWYLDSYRSLLGIEVLRKNGVKVFGYHETRLIENDPKTVDECLLAPNFPGIEKLVNELQWKG